MDLHRIRLRKPWRREAARGSVVWRRNFGRPSGLKKDDSVWLCIRGTTTDGSAALNGERLGRLSGPGETGQNDVTTRLRTRNELQIIVEGTVASDQSGLEPPTEVYLEIRSP